MTKLRIADGLSLPIETTTQAIGIVAKRRVGKSYTARRIAEQLFKAGQQIVIVDPKGDWWGIRSGADGKSPGLPVVILGGERGDVPLEVDGGEVVAKLVTEERVSVLLDLSLFRKREVATFMTSFLENLYRLKAKEALRTPLMLIIDEADAIAPQKPQEGEERMLGAAEDIVRRGGQRGIGCMMITQRTAVLNKNVLTQCEMLVALRTIAPQDLKAMQAWIDVHGTIEQRDELMASLPSLPQGDAWFWSPGWPTADGIFKRAHVLPIETFDSGATPKTGEKRVEPKRAADIDLEALRRQMAATIEKAKSEDPKLLRAKIAELTKELAVAAKAKPTASAAPTADVTLKIALRAQDQVKKEYARRIASLEKAVTQMSELHRRTHGSYLQALETFQAQISALRDELPEPTTEVGAQQLRHAAPEQIARAIASQPREPRPRPMAEIVDGDDTLSSTQQKMLDAIAFYDRVVDTRAPTRKQVAGFCGVSWDTGTFGTNLSKLRVLGLVADVNGGIALTDAGVARASNDAPPALADLHRTWRERLSSTQSSMMQVLIDAHPKAVTREQMAEKLGVSWDTGTFRTNLSKLRVLGLLDDSDRSHVVASDLLFPAGLE